MSEVGTGAVGEAPASGPSIRGMGPGGIPMKKKVFPKTSPHKLKENKGWKKSFSKFRSAVGGKRGS